MDCVGSGALPRKRGCKPVPRINAVYWSAQEATLAGTTTHITKGVLQSARVCGLLLGKKDELLHEHRLRELGRSRERPFTSCAEQRHLRAHEREVFNVVLRVGRESAFLTRRKMT